MVAVNPRKINTGMVISKPPPARVLIIPATTPIVNTTGN
jgi:hypothetical protein